MFSYQLLSVDGTALVTALDEEMKCSVGEFQKVCEGRNLMVYVEKKQSFGDDNGSGMSV